MSDFGEILNHWLIAFEEQTEQLIWLAALVALDDHRTESVDRERSVEPSSSNKYQETRYSLPISIGNLDRLISCSLISQTFANHREELQQPAFHAIEKLEYPELHEESVGILASIRAISKLMAVTGVDDFSTMDIFKPESKRTITHLSAIINLLKFKWVPSFSHLPWGEWPFSLDALCWIAAFDSSINSPLAIFGMFEEKNS